MKDFFEECFIYNRLVNDKMLEAALLNKQKLSDRTRLILTHILLVHQSWNNRMSGKEGLIDLWKPMEENLWNKVNLDNFVNTMSIIKDHPMDGSFTYQNSKGIGFTNKYQDVLFHLINHSSYHRGQLNVGFRDSGVEPVITEYIFYKR